MMGKEEKDLAAAVAVGTTIAVMENYVKALSVMLTVPEYDVPEESKLVGAIKTDLLKGILREVQLLRFLREEQGKESLGPL